MKEFLKIHSEDTVAVALRTLNKGQDVYKRQILHIMRHREEFIIAMILQIRQNQKKGSQENYLYLHQGSSSIVSCLLYTSVLTYVNHSRYYHYEVYVSEDGKEYRKVGEKVTDDSADFSNTFQTEGIQARYLKVQGTYNSANPGFHLYEVRATGTPMENEIANYQAVVDAKSKVPSDLSIYTFASVMELKFALANVQEGLPISRQDEVDAMAQAINDAIDALVFKAADYSKVDEAIKKAESLNKEEYVDFSKVEEAIKAVKRDLDLSLIHI